MQIVPYANDTRTHGIDLRQTCHESLIGTFYVDDFDVNAAMIVRPVTYMGSFYVEAELTAIFIVHCVSRIESIQNIVLKRSLSFYKCAMSSSSSLVSL